MSWWNKNKKTILLTTLGVFILLGLAIFSLMMLGPMIGGGFCHMTTCLGDGLHVSFIGGEPDYYIVEVDFPSGRRKIVCNLNASDSAYYSDEDHCESKGVFFEQLDSRQPSDLPAEELVVTVTFDGKQITKTFHPEYRIDYANGEECPPLCYFATIKFDLSE